MLDLVVDGQRPGDVTARAGADVGWTLDLHTAVPVDTVELLVNGAVVARFGGRTAGGSRRYEGRVRLPAGGGVAARATGGAIDAWPAMDSYVFAHTSPVWIGARASTTPATRRAAAEDLRRGLDAAVGRLRQAYTGTEIPALEAQFARARARLDEASRSSP
jgi:TolB protein